MAVTGEVRALKVQAARRINPPPAVFTGRISPLALLLAALLLFMGGGCKREGEEQTPLPQRQEETLRVTPKMQEISRRIITACGFEVVEVGGVKRGFAMTPQKGKSVPPPGTDKDGDGYASEMEIFFRFVTHPGEFSFTSPPPPAEGGDFTAQGMSLDPDLAAAVQKAQAGLAQRLKKGEIPFQLLTEEKQRQLGGADGNSDGWIAGKKEGVEALRVLKAQSSGAGGLLRKMAEGGGN